MSSVVVTKRKRYSRNKKKNWRKTDINDVEEHLEDVRLQQRTGGLVAEKSDDQLFFVDKADEDIESPSKRRKKEPKPLKCHALLEPDPNVKAFKVKHNVLKPETALKRKSVRTLSAEPKVTKAKVLSTEQRKQCRLATRSRRVNRNTVTTANKDLWADEIPDKVAPVDDEFYLKYTKKAPIKTPRHHGKKPSGLSAIEAPHPGQSYNPTFTAHQELLQSALTVEVKRTKEEERIKRALDDKFPSLANAPKQSTWLAEMSSGLGDHDDGDEVTYTEEELGRVSVNPPVRRDDKKTEKQRRKEKEQKEKEKQSKKDKVVKARKNQITSHLKSLKKQVLQQEVELNKRLTARQQKKLANKDAPKKLGKLKYEDANIPIKLTDELVGSLRELKPEGHLLEDRFKSLQKRNIIEPRARAKFVRRYKVKTVEKKTHKEITA